MGVVGSEGWELCFSVILDVKGLAYVRIVVNKRVKAIVSSKTAENKNCAEDGEFIIVAVTKVPHVSRSLSPSCLTLYLIYTCGRQR